VHPSFEELARQQMRRIRQIARRYASADAVDDLTQDILVRLWRSWPRFRGDSEPTTWVYRVALNAAMTYVKHEMRGRALKSKAQKMLAPQFALPGVAEADILAAFLAQLGAIDASVMMMHLDGLTTVDMANVLGMTPNAVAVRVSRLREKFSDIVVD
jgi:RNA polymerase sigma-70 factor (ECF subfamily)